MSDLETKRDKIIAILDTLPFYTPVISYRIQGTNPENSMRITLSLKSAVTQKELEDIMCAFKNCAHIYALDFRYRKIILYI